MTSNNEAGVRAVQVGIVINAALAGTKLAAGIFGNTYALVADATESASDIVSSLIVWGGISVAARPADEDHPFGHGKAEALAASVVSLMLLGAAVWIAYSASVEIRTPHNSPAPWTLIVIAGAMLIKTVLSRRVGHIAAESGSTAVEADAAHHLSDAVTSAAAFIGISIAIIGEHFWPDSRWSTADDWAALIASLVIAFNGISMLRAASDDLMDRMPGPDVVDPIRRAAESVEGVLATEKLHVRKTGAAYTAAIHVQARSDLPLAAAHALGGAVKSAILERNPRVGSVLVHMEPYQAAGGGEAGSEMRGVE